MQVFRLTTLISGPLYFLVNMEWLNIIPVNLDGGFISLGILLCSLVVLIWVVFWFGSWDDTAPGNDEHTWRKIWLEGLGR